MNQQFNSKKSFLEWLKTISKGMILSITLIGGAYEASYTAVHPKALERINQLDNDFLAEGQYMVSYEESDDEDQEIEYSDFACAITFEVTLASSICGAKFGGRRNLISKLDPYECCFRFDKNNQFNIGHVWIKLPTNHDELKELRTVLFNESAFYIFPDGTSTINKANFKQGNGMRLAT
jgi:hypothetical protein